MVSFSINFLNPTVIKEESLGSSFIIFNVLVYAEGKNYC